MEVDEDVQPSETESDQSFTKGDFQIGMPIGALRNFNELDVMGHVERDGTGTPFVMLANEEYRDKNNRLVTSYGYLLDRNRHVVSVYNGSSLFRTLLNPDTLPAPFLFERFNFNPFACFGNFKHFKKDDDPTTCVKHVINGRLFDDLRRPVN